MSAAIEINHFSLISRLFGNLFYRAPTDPILAGAFDWLQQQGLAQVWPLETDKDSDAALQSLQAKLDVALLKPEYEKLFGANGKVPTSLSGYGLNVADFENFRHTRNMPPLENADHVALLLLTAAWLEDNSDSRLAQQTFFEDFLLPCAAQFLTQVETYATLPFYRALATLTRELLAATADELEEDEKD